MPTPSDTEMLDWVEKHMPYFSKIYSSRGESICCSWAWNKSAEAKTYRGSIAAAMAEGGKDAR